MAEPRVQGQDCQERLGGQILISRGREELKEISALAKELGQQGLIMYCSRVIETWSARWATCFSRPEKYFQALRVRREETQ